MTLSDIALLVQQLEENYNKCKAQNRRLKIKLNKSRRNTRILKKKIRSYEKNV